MLCFSGIKSEKNLAASCPLSFEISPCECTEANENSFLLICVDDNADRIRKALSVVASKNMAFEFISISSSGITYLNRNFLENIQVNKVLFALYNLKLIHDLAFSGQENSLKHVQIHTTQLSHIPTEPFRATKALESYELILSRNIEVIGEDNFKGMNCSSTITSLNFAENSISSIEKGAFAYLENLQRLTLSGNRLRYLNADSFSGRTNQLSFLNLRYVAIMYIFLNNLYTYNNLNRFLEGLTGNENVGISKIGDS